MCPSFAVASLRAEEAVDFQRIDIQQNKSMGGCNALASTASPNAPISLPLARGHLPLDGQCLKRAHGWGGGLCLPKKRGYYFFIIHFIYHFLFYANPLPSFIPHSLNLHNRQVDDCIADDDADDGHDNDDANDDDGGCGGRDGHHRMRKGRGHDDRTNTTIK